MEIFKARNGLPNFLAKLRNAQDVCIGYLGGSITLAEGYRPKTVKWFQDKYSGSKITHINAGIGGTGSVLGVFRIDNDILVQNPDLVFVEFSSNDCEHTTQEWCMSAMEGIVRKIWNQNPETDICFLYTINLPQREALHQDKLYWTAETMEKIAEHYGIPSINMGVEVIRQEKLGNLVYRVEADSEEEIKARNEDKIVFSYDSVHPTLDDGHDLYLKVISECFEEMDSIDSCEVRKIPQALSETPWTSARLLPISCTTLSNEWQEVNPADEGLTCENIHRFKPLYKTSVPGAEIKFKFKGTGFGVFSIFGLNSGQFKVFIDGKLYGKAPLFDQYGNSYRVHYRMIATDLEDEDHDVLLELGSEPTDKSMLLPERKIDDPKKLEGIICYVSKILVLGDLK
jgi:GDSL-like lipase/acylhydrolase family protein